MKKSSSFYPNHKSFNKLHNPSTIHKISSNPHNASSIRITSGSLRGRTLISPESSGTHPMGSREKLALFNMLMSELPPNSSSESKPPSTSSARAELPQSKLQNLNILDAYAGSGALGIEALSRGAKSVVFVEKSPAVAKIICQNLQNLHLLNQDPIKSYHLEVKNQSVAEFIRNDFKASQSKCNHNDFSKISQYDLILADPPYDNFNITEISNLATLLVPEGILALSHPDIAPKLENLALLKTRTYARAHISLYQRIPSSPNAVQNL